MIVEFKKRGIRTYEDLPKNENGNLKIQVPDGKDKRIVDLIQIMPKLEYDDLWFLYRDCCRGMALHNKADEAEKLCGHKIYI